MRATVVVTLLFVVLVPASASASPSDADLPDLPRPETLPELTHRFTEITAETVFASVALAPGTVLAGQTGGKTDLRSRESVRIERLSFELPLASRKWFAGGAYAFALGSVTGGHKLISGNPELYLRGVWASIDGLAFGGGLGFVIPTRGWGDGGDALDVATAASAVTAWDRAAFDPNAFTSRAYIDMRDAAGPFVVQYRQAIEVAVDTRDTSQYTFAEVGTLYVDLRISKLITAGSQLVEYYSLEPDIADASRAHWSLGGDVRITTRYFQPMFAVMTSLGSPLRALSTFGSPLGASPESFVGVRLGVSFVLDTQPKHPTP